MTRLLDSPAGRLLPALAIAALLALVALPAFGRAAFVADDFRLLLQARALTSGDLDAMLRALVVENRWDGDWWIPDGTVVLFFRPFVIASLALDRALWGEHAVGFVVGNLILHALASLCAYGCLRRLALARGPALAGALVFAVLACRAEQVFFAAGRTDTIPGLALVFGIYVGLAPRPPSRRRDLAFAGIYFVALLAKESTVWLPLAWALIDRWRAGPGARGVVRQHATRYVACAFALAAYLALRTAVLGGAGALPSPYVFTPADPGFLAHLGLAAGQYAASLVAGLPVPPFLTHLGDLGLTWAIFGLAGVALALALAWRTRTGRLCAVLFLLALLPQLPLYTSGRYLYPASLPWCAILALGVGWLARGSVLLAVAATGAMLALQGGNLHAELGRQPLYFDGVSMGEWTARLFRQGPLQPGRARPVYVVDLPLSWLDTQFLQQTLDIAWPEGDITVRTLCRSPQTAVQGLCTVRRVGPDTVELARPNGRLQEPRSGAEFAQRRVALGERIRERDYEVEVLAERDGEATAVRVRFDRPLAELQLVRCRPVRGGWVLEPVR